VYRCENYRLTAIIASLLAYQAQSPQIGSPYVSALQVYRTAINQGLSGHVNCYLILLSNAFLPLLAIDAPFSFEGEIFYRFSTCSSFNSLL